MSAHEKVLNNDSYELAFNNANTALTIAALCLKKCKVYIVDVTKFKKPAMMLLACLLAIIKLKNYYIFTYGCVANLPGYF